MTTEVRAEWRGLQVYAEVYSEPRTRDYPGCVDVQNIGVGLDDQPLPDEAQEALVSAYEAEIRAAILEKFNGGSL